MMRTAGESFSDKRRRNRRDTSSHHDTNEYSKNMLRGQTFLSRNRRQFSFQQRRIGNVFYIYYTTPVRIMDVKILQLVLRVYPKVH